MTGMQIIPADGWWFIARSAEGDHLMLIRTHQIDQTIISNHMQYNAWGIRDIDGHGCFVFEKDPCHGINTSDVLMKGLSHGAITTG